MTPMPFANCSWVYLPLAAHLCCSVSGREGPGSSGAVCPCPLSPQRQSSCDDLQMCLQEFPSPHYLQGFFCPKTLCCWPQGSLFHCVQCQFCYSTSQGKATLPPDSLTFQEKVCPNIVLRWPIHHPLQRKQIPACPAAHLGAHTEIHLSANEAFWDPCECLCLTCLA